MGSDPKFYHCNLLTSHALKIIAAKRPEHARDLKHIAAICDREARFPDGTLLLEGGRSADVIWNYLVKNQLIGEGGIWQPCGYGSIAPLQHEVISLYNTTEYRDGLGYLAFHVFFPSMVST